MNTFHFGFGEGILSKKEIFIRERIAKQFNIEFHCISDHCSCGYGCNPNKCKIKKYWYSAQNKGEFFDSSLAKKVLDELRKHIFQRRK